MAVADGVPLAGKAVGALDDHAWHADRGSEMCSARVETDQQAAPIEQRGRFGYRKTPGCGYRLPVEAPFEAGSQVPFGRSADDRQFEIAKTEQAPADLQETVRGPRIGRLLAPGPRAMSGRCGYFRR
jgi:hypothetical protein